MNRGLYVAGTSMITNRQKMDVIANNIANSTTTGFKEDTMVSQSFSDMLLSATNEMNVVNSTREVGPFNTGIHVDAVYTDFETGPITSTDSKTDMAIEGNGFFVVNTPDGIRYTRDGSFGIDAAGFLVTQGGNRVLGTNGEIYVGDGELSVNTAGDIFVNGERTNSFRIDNVADLNSLRKEGNNLYVGDGAAINDGYAIRQSALEASNVDIISGIVDMMTVYRNYESSQRVIQIIDSTLGKAVNDIGRI